MTIFPPASTLSPLSFAVALISLGSLLIVCGFLHRSTVFDDWDMRTFQFLHFRFRPYSSLFRYLWPLGTTPVAVMLILIIFITSHQMGWIATFTYIWAAIIERFIKVKSNRPRPFDTSPGVVMSQPQKPQDPSHPSGDSMRVTFLALVFPFAFGLTWPVYALTLVVAITLCLGRIVLGVHYPLDVFGGSGLGLLATGIAIISHHLNLFG